MYLREENSVDLRTVLEPGQYSHAFDLPSTTVDIELAKTFRISLWNSTRGKLVFAANTKKTTTDLQCKNVVGKDYNLVPSVLVVLDEELACLELVWVHAIQQHPLSRLLSEVLAIELWRHWAPDFGTLSLDISHHLLQNMIWGPAPT